MMYMQKADTNGNKTQPHTNMKITTLQIRMHGDEDDLYVFNGYHDLNALFPFIKKWLDDWDLDYDDENETWFKTINQTTFDKLI